MQTQRTPSNEKLEQFMSSGHLELLSKPVAGLVCGILGRG